MIKSPKKSCMEEATKLFVYRVQGNQPFPEAKLSNDIALWVPKREWGGGPTKKVVRIRCTKR